MKISIVISILFLLMLNLFIYECNGQTNELPSPTKTGVKDTVFFEIKPKFNRDWIQYEEGPEFPGGTIALKNYISENTNYPQTAIKDSIEGEVHIMFVIDIDGSTKNFKIYKSVQKDIDNECIRVVKEMPKWKPGTNVFSAKKGLYTKVVPRSYNIIFNFVLKDGEKKKGICKKDSMALMRRRLFYKSAAR